MKYISAMFLFSLIALPLWAQQYGIQWADTIDNGDDDLAQGIAVDDSGNVYVTGYSYNGSTYDYLTVKYNALGNIVWEDTLDNGSNDFAFGTTVDDSGNVYVTGGSYISSNYDYLTVKYNALGNIVWVDTLDNGSNDFAFGIAVDGSGNVYVTGESYNGSTNDYLTMKYDSVGNIVWADTLDNGSNDYARGIAVDGSGNVYVTGGFSNGLNNDYLTVKYDALGNIVWADTIDNGDDDLALGIAVDGSGNVYVTGESVIGSNYNYLTVKYDALGNTLWADTLDNGGTDYARGIAVDGSGNVYVTGRSYIGTNTDYLTVKYDSFGNILWADTLDNGGTDAAYGIAVDRSGNVYVTGESNNGSNGDYLTVKYAKYRDAGILSITSPDTVGIDSSYIPQIWVKNNSYEDTLNFDITAYIDSSGIHIYTDLKSVYNLPPVDSVIVNFDPWLAPSNPVDLTLSFSIITSDMNADNDTISQALYVRDLTPPVIDSAIASDGTNAVSGIDDDDYVILYFSEPTNKVVIDNSNIDNVLSLSGGHTWLDGFTALGSCYWSADGTQLMINLTTNTSLPTITVGDTITPDGATITDVNGNPCSSPVILGGSFDPSGINDTRKPRILSLSVSGINRGKIAFTCGIPDAGDYSISLYSIDGRIIRKIQGTQIGYHKGVISGLRSGIYFLKLRQGKKVITKRVIVEK